MSKIVTNPISELQQLYTSNTARSNILLRAGESVLLGNYVQADLQLVVQANISVPNTFVVGSFTSADGRRGKNVTLSTHTPPPRAYAYMSGFDLPGLDYAINNSFGTNMDPQSCQALCVAQPDQCKAWTFVAPGVQQPQARCCLKNGVPAPVSHLGMVSGAPGAGPMPQIDGAYAALDGTPFLIGKGDGAITLRFLLDHSVVEVFAQNGRAVATYPYCPVDPTSDTGGNDVSLDQKSRCAKQEEQRNKQMNQGRRNGAKSWVGRYRIRHMLTAMLKLGFQLYNNGPNDLVLLSAQLHTVATANVLPS